MSGAQEGGHLQFIVLSVTVAPALVFGMAVPPPDLRAVGLFGTIQFTSGRIPELRRLQSTG